MLCKTYPQLCTLTEGGSVWRLPIAKKVDTSSFSPPEFDLENVVGSHCYE